MNYTILTAILFCLLLITPSLVSAKPYVKPYDYDQVWQEIHQLENNGLPQSMGKKIDSLYAAAVKENKTDQQLKALIYKLKVMQQREEFAGQKAIDKVVEELKTSTFPASAIIHSMLAQLYWDYYQQNRWRFSQRTETIDFKRDDIATWDLKTITKECIKEYGNSLQRAVDLQKIRIDDFPAILNQGGRDERALRPTLYDFLAHRALDFYEHDESGLTMPFDEFSITDTKFFQPPESFVKLNITTSDTLSFKYIVLKLYQDLILFHLKDADPAALVEVDLDRLGYVYAKSDIADSEVNYEAALRLLQSRYKDNPASALAIFRLATLINSLGSRYNSELGEDYRWHYKQALEICRQGMKDYPNSYGGQSCSTLAHNIQVPGLNLTTENSVIPGSPVKALLKLKNLSAAEVRIYRIKEPTYRYDYYDEEESWQKDNYKKVRQQWDKQAYWQKVFRVENEGDFREHSYEIALGSLPKGYYIILVKSLGEKTEDSAAYFGFAFLKSTSISYVAANGSTDKLMLLNRKTGLPISDAIVKLYKQNYNDKTYKYYYTLEWTGSSNLKGYVTIPKKDQGWGRKVVIISKGDTLNILNFYGGNHPQQKQVRNQTLLFTDRAIYRPGQTIYVKGVQFQTDGEKYHELATGGQVYLTFRDVNYQEVEHKTLSINEYGTFNTTFTAPQGVLTGQMTIQTSYGSVGVSVEEYKRPRFEVKIDKPKETFKLNQYVTVKGKALAYAGFPIDNANVTYQIVRQPKYPYWFWWWGLQPSSPQKEIMHGTLTTDARGEFTLTFLAAGDNTVLTRYNPYFVFSITADVTDLSGETRSGSLYLNIGEKELIITPEIAEKIDLQNKKLIIPVKTTNLSNEPIAVSGTLTISRLQPPDHVQKNRLWSAPDRDYLDRDEFLKAFPNDIYGKEDQLPKWKVLEQVYAGSFETPENDSLSVKDFSRWKPGVYVLEATASYKQQEVKTTRYFTVYNSSGSELPYLMADWLVPVKVLCEPGETAKVLIGSGYENVSVLYELEKDHVIIDTMRFTLSRSQRLFSLPVKESDRGGFYLHFTFIKDGRLYTHTQMITVPWTNKRIDFEYMTFRNKLLPGQDEEWRLKLKDYTGGKVTAELLASMYDASLDAFRSSDWSANIYGMLSRTWGWSNYSFVSSAALQMISTPGYAYYPNRDFDDFYWWGYHIREYYGGGWLHAPSLKAVKDVSGSSRSIDVDALSDRAIANVEDIVALQSGVTNIGGELHVRGNGESEEGGIGSGEEEDLSGVQARTNFAETAFFYPELRTDEKGEVSFVFKVPEALTKWKFRAFALTKDLKIGTTENSTVTQKPMMVLPNAPRFFREGDKITFSTKITSLDETDQSGSCQLYLFDAITMAPVEKDFKLTKAQQPFSVKKGESTSLSWDLTIPFGISAATYRVVARAGDFSDGEESTLPILTNRMLVTESLPLPVPGNSTKSFVFEKLKNSGSSTTIKNHKLTLEYTSNPAWYAVQALPYMMEYPYECNEQIFTRFYANSLASHIANSNPRIKRVFDSWKNTPNSEALLSNLEKNQELKAMLLQETPWVLDAKNESASKQRISLLFDLNNMANQYNSAFTKLQKNQNPSGAWPWFPGMQDSWWVTQYIVEGFGHLDHLSVKAIRSDARVWNMVQKAVAYIDREILRDYNSIINKELDNLGYIEMHYLYARSFFRDIKIPTETQVAVDYFLGQADKYWLKKDLYGQGLIALALHRFEKRVTPNKVIASLKEKALHNEEMGMWWKNDNWGWFWYQAPIETQSLLIEAFHDVADDTPSVDEMRTWLLKNKQTTNWKTTKATAEACYALLISGTEWLDTEKLAEITLGGKIIDPMKLDGVQVEAGTGYFKTSWSGSDITPQMANVTVTNPNRVSSWGSLYWQYFENLDKITPAETPLKLKKQLFIERITDTGKVLEPVSDKAQLSIGDKVIVRIELRTDRDMEYVHMKDMRAAGFEPINVLSRSKWQDGLWYYESTGDAATNFFIEYLRKGTFVFEYPLRVFNKGDFSNGITTIQCMYAPEFTSHSEGIRVNVK
jgi:uncharacterized protein YfaS (alpha-2-macroglobulin family)